VCEIIFERPRRDPGWQQLDHTGEGYVGYVEFVGSRNPRALVFAAQEVFWQLVIEGILAPGIDSSDLNLPWFHVTEYGKDVVQSGGANPHDPTGYLNRLREKIPNPDPTVMAYLQESLATFRRGNRVASTVMLGIAPERVANRCTRRPKRAQGFCENRRTVSDKAKARLGSSKDPVNPEGASGISGKRQRYVDCYF
jgi:hypothetical protein